MNRNRGVTALLGIIATSALIAFGANSLIKRTDAGFRIRPPPAWAPSRPDADEGTQKTFYLDAPSDSDDTDAGVADAARKFAIQFVTPDLKVADSAEFPEDTIHFERLTKLNQTTAGRIEHWYVDGAVDSYNDYGVRVSSHWRVMLARADDRFLPVMAQLGDFEIYRMHGHMQMLAEARRLAWQAVEARAAELKANELAANRAVWQAIDAAKPAEEKARAALKLAINLLAAGREEPARRRLQDVIDKFPGTKAASEAEELLRDGAK